MNTVECWKCSAPFSVHFVSKHDISGVPQFPWVTEGNGVLLVSVGFVRLTLARKIVVSIPIGSTILEFPIELDRIEKILDGNGGEIWG